MKEGAQYNESELAAEVAAAFDITESSAKSYVSETLAALRRAIARERYVNLRNFGVFNVHTHRVPIQFGWQKHSDGHNDENTWKQVEKVHFHASPAWEDELKPE